MANESKTIVIQHNEDGTPVRMVVNVIDTVTGEFSPKVVNYDDLLADEKIKYDDIVAVANSKI